MRIWDDEEEDDPGDAGRGKEVSREGLESVAMIDR